MLPARQGQAAPTTSERHRPGPRTVSEIVKARVRLVIESVFSNLKHQMRLEDHLAKTPFYWVACPQGLRIPVALWQY